MYVDPGHTSSYKPRILQHTSRSKQPPHHSGCPHYAQVLVIAIPKQCICMITYMHIRTYICTHTSLHPSPAHSLFPPVLQPTRKTRKKAALGVGSPSSDSATDSPMTSPAKRRRKKGFEIGQVVFLENERRKAAWLPAVVSGKGIEQVL